MVRPSASEDYKIGGEKNVRTARGLELRSVFTNLKGPKPTQPKSQLHAVIYVKYIDFNIITA